MWGFFHIFSRSADSRGKYEELMSESLGMNPYKTKTQKFLKPITNDSEIPHFWIPSIPHSVSFV